MNPEEWHGLSTLDRLRMCFTADRLPPFGPDDFFDECEGAIFINRAMPMAANGDLAHLAMEPLFRDYLEQVEQNLCKITFGRLNNDEFERRFQSPRHSTILSHSRRGGYGRYHEALIVNRSKDSIRHWVHNCLIPTTKNGTDRITMLIGDVGAGKSTLNKYISTVFFPAFKAERIVVSRIEYKKLDTHIGRPHNHGPETDEPHRRRLREAIERNVFCAITRDIFSFAWSEPREMRSREDARHTFTPLQAPSWPELDMMTREGQERLTAFMNDRYGPPTRMAERGIDPAATIREVQCAIGIFRTTDMTSRKRWFDALLIDADRLAVLEPFVQYAVEVAKIRLFVIFDGLDWVQIADFIGYTRNRENLQAIAQWLIDGRRAVALPRLREFLYPTFQVTMRPNTYELFWRDYSPAQIDTQGPIYHVVPPEARDIIGTISTGSLFEDEDGSAGISRAETLEFFSKVQFKLSRSLGVRPRDLNNLFMKNARYRVHFARNVIEEVCRPALEKIETSQIEPSRAILIENLRVEMLELLDGKEYRLVDMLLHAKNERFANFIRIDGAGIDLDRHRADPGYLQTVLCDNNLKSGYVGNVFNYHIPYEDHRDLEFLLEKIRILDLLIESGDQPMEVADLRRKFAKRGWRVSRYLDFSIAILVRENMVAGYNIEFGASGYVATLFGKMVRTHLASNMIYLENVFFGTLLPKGIKRRGKDIYRSIAQRHEWVAASIYHCWLFLRLVRTAEPGKPSAFFEELRGSVAQTIDRILNAKGADPRIATFALRYISEFEEQMTQ